MYVSYIQLTFIFLALFSLQNSYISLLIAASPSLHRLYLYSADRILSNHCTFPQLETLYVYRQIAPMPIAPNIQNLILDSSFVETVVTSNIYPKLQSLFIRCTNLHNFQSLSIYPIKILSLYMCTLDLAIFNEIQQLSMLKVV